MTQPPPRSAHDELLAQVGWVRALAAQVARDSHAAEDLAQEALLLAMRSSREEPRSLRAWLTTVVRRLGQSRARAEHRRTRRELRREQPEPSPSPLELVERAASQRDLVDALLGLAEPYRSTLLMRYFEELSPREIAARSGRPESTIATRTAEGLRRLRLRIEDGREDQGRHPLAALAPLLGWSRPRHLPPVIQGALVMSLKSKLVGLSTLLACSLSLVHFGADPLTPSPARPELVRQEADLAPLRARSSGLARFTALVAQAPAPDASLATRAEVEGAAPMRGRVVDVHGRAVGGVRVSRVDSSIPRDSIHAGFRRSPGPDFVLADEDGEFEYPGRDLVQLTVEDERWVALANAVLPPRVPGVELPIVLLAERVPLAGLIVDAGGQAVPGASALVRHARGALGALGAALEFSPLNKCATRSDRDGHFEFERAAWIEGTCLSVQAPGFARVEVAIPAGGTTDLRVELERAAPSGIRVSGQVRYADGLPVTDAHVSCGAIAVRTDAQGAFLLEHEEGQLDPSRALIVRAARPGYLPATLELLAPVSSRALDESFEEVVLVLAERALSITGRVVDESGLGIAGLELEALDTTDFGYVPLPGSESYERPSLERMSGGGMARTNAEGEFELRGLLEHDYRIEVMQNDSLLYAVSEPFEAGARGARIVLETSRLGTLAGRILDEDGVGVAGVRVSVTKVRPDQLAIGRADTTDAQGGFRLTGVTTSPEFLRLEGAPIVPQLFARLAPGADPEALELVAARRHRLRVDWGDWRGRADRLTLLDARDQVLPMVILEGGVTPLESLRVSEGLSAVLNLSGAARSAVLSLAGEEVSRVAIELAPEGITLLEL